MLVGAFVASRAAALAAGVRFDAGAIHYASQVADPEVLSDHLVETLWYLHSQPPGFNLLIGAVLRWSPFGAGDTLHVIFLGIGLALVLGLYDLARQLGAPRWWSVGIAVLVGCSPAAILYEHWLSYEVPVAALLVWLVAATARWVRTGSTWALGAVTGLAAAAVLTRSLMHPVWFLAVVALALLARRPAAWRWGPVVALVLPMVLVGGALVKNQALFGSPTLSSWMGFNLNKVVVGTLPEDDLARLRADGVITTGQIPSCEPSRPDVAILAEEHKRDWRGEEGIENHNWECLLPWYDSLFDDAVGVVRAEPGHAAWAVGGSFEIWASPSTHYPSFVDNREQIAVAEAIHRHGVLLSVPWNPPIDLPNAWAVELSAPDERFHISLTTVAATLLVLVAGAVALVQWRRRGLGPARAALVMGAGTIAFATLATNLFEHGENNRIRYVVEPLTLGMAATVVVVLVIGRVAARAQSRTIVMGTETAG